MEAIKVGDFVKGVNDSRYGITNSKMTKGLVTEASATEIRVKILEHEDGITGDFSVDPQYFEVIGHQKKFDRETVLELLKNGCEKGILDYDLRGANIDFSSWPLWCGGLHVKTDKRLACQLAYHLCAMECEDEEFIAMRNSILGFANQFHRAEECGILEPICLPISKEVELSTELSAVSDAPPDVPE